MSSARTKRPPCGSTGSRVHTSELSAEPCRNREARIGSAIPPFRRFSDPGFGCGTPLTLMVDAAEPAGIIVGGALRIGLAKAAARQSKIQLLPVSPGPLPFQDCSFDRVLSCLVFHHLRRADRLAALKEC